jgi:hypothetical protein
MPGVSYIIYYIIYYLIYIRHPFRPIRQLYGAADCASAQDDMDA